MAKSKNIRRPAATPAGGPAVSFFRSRAGTPVLCLLLFAVVVWTFWPALRGQFMFYDEYGYLLGNAHVNTGLSWANAAWALTSTDFSNWYPLTWMSHMLDFQLYGPAPWEAPGPNPRGHHLTNVLLHAGCAVLLFLVLKRMTGTRWRSLLVAGLFALHPLRVESVAWISERKDVLSTFFWLLALWTYARFAEETHKQVGRVKTFYVLTFLFFVLGMMSKSMLVTFPCVLLLLDYWPLNRWTVANARRLILEKIPFFLVIPVVSWIAYVAQLRSGLMNEMASLPLEGRVENAVVSYARYLGKFFFPSDLCIYYPHPGWWPGAYVLLAAGLLAGLSAFGWLERRRFPFFFAGWFWYVGTAVPVIGLEQLCSQSIADRYTYVPIIGVAILIVWGLHTLTKQWRYQAKAALLGGGLLLCVCVALTRYEIGFWKDGDTVWRRAEAVTQDNYVAHSNRGMVLGSANPDESLAEFEAAVKINPNYPEAQRSLADGLHQRGQLDKAMLHYRAAAQADPGDSRVQYGWGIACYQKGNVDDAIVHFQKAHAINPDYLPYMDGLASLLAQKNRYAEAVPLLKKICEVQTNNPNAFNTLGIVLLKSGQFDDAITNFQKALVLAPNDASVRNNLAAAISAKEHPAAPVP